MTRFRPPTSEHPQPKGLSLSDDPTYTRFRPPYVTDQPKYAGVPQRQRSVLHLRAQQNIPEPSSGTFADVPTTRITGSADRPAHHPAQCAQPHLRTCAPAPNLPCAPAHRPAHLRPTSLRTCAPAPNFPAHLRLTPAHLRWEAGVGVGPNSPALRNFPDQSSADLPTTPPTRTPHAPAPTRAPALNTCALRTQPPSQPPSPMRLPPTAPPAPPPASPARLAPAPAP
ncbi:hypothetical protein C8J57DRAFT_1516778 [Mycena rebaudengoi]|nr:hypothetical protein C8J57DRAFT_1516778 [Mycena rebaudengoi]